jgi:hypothetical protein
MNVELRPLISAQQILCSCVEKIETASLGTIICFCFSQLLQSTASIREIIERGLEFKVVTVTAEKDLMQINDAVNGFFERGKFSCGGTTPSLHLYLPSDITSPCMAWFQYMSTMLPSSHAFFLSYRHADRPPRPDS